MLTTFIGVPEQALGWCLIQLGVVVLHFHALYIYIMDGKAISTRTLIECGMGGAASAHSLPFIRHTSVLSQQIGLPSRSQ